MKVLHSIRAYLLTIGSAGEWRKMKRQHNKKKIAKMLELVGICVISMHIELYVHSLYGLKRREKERKEGEQICAKTRANKVADSRQQGMKNNERI